MRLSLAWRVEQKTHDHIILWFVENQSSSCQKLFEKEVLPLVISLSSEAYVSTCFLIYGQV